MKSDQAGFTIIELLIATAIFAVILILTSTTIIGITQTYVKGSVEDQTQQTARAILTDISQDIQFNQQPYYLTDYSASPSSDEYWFCIGNDIYVYKLDKYLSATKTGPEYSSWGLVRYTSTTCPIMLSQISIPADAAELLSANERLGELDITPVTGTAAYTISVEVAYGEDDLLNDDTSYPTISGIVGPHNLNGSYTNGSSASTAGYQYSYQCQTGLDSSFCDVSTLTTTVAPRIQ